LNPPRPDPNVFTSPLGDESIQGYPDGKPPYDNRVREIREVVQILEGADIPSYMVAEPALIYYGAGRVMMASSASGDKIYLQYNICMHRNESCPSQQSS
jgi:hypothetical protein